MRAVCPCCSRALKRQEERRYLTGKYTEHFNVGYSKLYRYHCKGRLGCRHEWMLRIDIPLDVRLQPTLALCYNWGAWAASQKTKPGIDPMRTTCGQFSVLIHRDVAETYQRVLDRSGDAQKKIA